MRVTSLTTPEFDVFEMLAGRWHKRRQKISGIRHVPRTALHLGYIICAEEATAAFGTSATSRGDQVTSASGGEGWRFDGNRLRLSGSSATSVPTKHDLETDTLA